MTVVDSQPGWGFGGKELGGYRLEGVVLGSLDIRWGRLGKEEGGFEKKPEEVIGKGMRGIITHTFTSSPAFPFLLLHSPSFLLPRLSFLLSSSILVHVLFVRRK